MTKILVVFTIAIAVLFFVCLSIKNTKNTKNIEKIDFIMKRDNRYVRGQFILLGGDTYEVRMYENNADFFGGEINRTKMIDILNKGMKDRTVLPLTLSDKELSKKTNQSIDKIQNLRKINIV